MNMSRRSRRISWVFIFFVGSAFGQLAPDNSFSKGKLFDISLKKTGPYFSLQRGKYTVPEIGVERQCKQIKYKTENTYHLSMEFNLNFKYNVLGYDIGYWIKPSRIGLTYGLNMVMRTDFDETRIGFAPVIGYKLFGFHLQTGYNFLTRPVNFTQTNTFFISLRFTLINDRDVDVDRKKGSLFKKK